MKKSNKGGRPLLTDTEDRKTKYISVRVSERELGDFKKYAEYHNLKPSEFLRNLAYQKIGVSIKKKPTKSTEELRKEIRKIGVNVNQILIKAHHNNLSNEMILKLENSLSNINIALSKL